MNGVYVIDVSGFTDPQKLDKAIEYLNKARRDKIQKLKTPESKACSAGVELALRYAVEHKTEYKYSELDFRITKHGKPYVNNNPFYFSLSHSYNYAVCAISDSPVGVDIEKNKHMSNKIAAKYFYGNNDIKEWTKRESRGKLTGNGFFDTSTGKHIYSHFSIPDGYIITVCSETMFEKITFIDPEEVLV